MYKHNMFWLKYHIWYLGIVHAIRRLSEQLVKRLLTLRLSCDRLTLCLHKNTLYIFVVRGNPLPLLRVLGLGYTRPNAVGDGDGGGDGGAGWAG